MRAGRRVQLQRLRLAVRLLWLAEVMFTPTCVEES